MPDIPLYGSFQKTFFKKDDIKIDNYLFRLHHQVSSALVIIGILFIFAENYLDGKAIECTGGNAYQTRFCWLHGAGYVAESLQKSGVTKCFMKEDPGDLEDWSSTDDNGQTTASSHAPKTAYYIWLPFLLVACLGLSKLPRTLWKILEQGIMEDLVGEPGGGQSEHAAKRFIARRKKYMLYQIYFAFCELLNIACVLLSMAICNGLLRGKFWNYGTDILKYNKYTSAQLDEQQPANPMCNIFPTEVSCHVFSGGNTGAADSANLLCMLSNNLFNQYYFAILWFWWVLLLTVSFLGVGYRAGRMFIAGFNNTVAAHQISYDGLEMLQLTTPDIFVLGRLANNLPSDIMEEVINKIKKDRKGDSSMLVEDNDGIELKNAV